MNSNTPAHDYLWDPAGEPAPVDRLAADVQRLEQTLAPLRSRGASIDPPADAFAEQLFRGRWTDFLRFSYARTQTKLAFVAIAALLLFGVYFAWNPIGTSGAAWNVSRIAGLPQLGSATLSARARLHLGQALITDSSSQARIEVEDLGEIAVAENSRVRLLASGSASGTLGLDQGTIHAMIWAPPRRFTVRTPGAEAIDLGCSYTLHVSPDGAGWLRVSTGWVAFTDPSASGRESFIPVGAMCLLRPGKASETKAPATQPPAIAASQVGTPFYEDSSTAFRQSLELFDFGDSSAGPSTNAAEKSRSLALRLLLDEARQRDAITLWHLLARTDFANRAAVYDRLAILVPPPAGVVRDTLLSSDPALANQRREMRDLWWNALGLRDTDWWRYWERPAPPR
jgi:hypothetical protein